MRLLETFRNWLYGPIFATLDAVEKLRGELVQHEEWNKARMLSIEKALAASPVAKRLNPIPVIPDWETAQVLNFKHLEEQDGAQNRRR